MTALLIVCAGWLFVAFVVILFGWRAASIKTPKPVPSKELTTWMRAAARVEHRRTA